jgi:hypothetical protein
VDQGAIPISAMTKQLYFFINRDTSYPAQQSFSW